MRNGVIINGTLVITISLVHFRLLEPRHHYLLWKRNIPQIQQTAQACAQNTTITEIPRGETTAKKVFK